MTLIDWGARWRAVPDERPGRVWLPAQRPAPAGDAEAAARPPRRPQHVAVTLTAAQAERLPWSLPDLLAHSDLGPNDRVTVDLGDVSSAHLTGLTLLLRALWRRVGPDGDVTLTGGTPGLRAQLNSLAITPASCRASVHGTPPVATPAAEWLTPAAASTRARLPVTVPAQRRSRDAAAGERNPATAGLVLTGEVTHLSPRTSAEASPSTPPYGPAATVPTPHRPAPARGRAAVRT